MATTTTIKLESLANSVIVNGELSSKEGWKVTQEANGKRVYMSNATTGVTVGGIVSTFEVDGVTYETVENLYTALANIL